MDVEKELWDFIEKNFSGRQDETKLSQDYPLLDSGLIDSAGIFELTGFMEKQFKIKVLDEEIAPENFKTINKLAAFINMKLKNK